MRSLDSIFLKDVVVWVDSKFGSVHVLKLEQDHCIRDKSSLVDSFLIPYNFLPSNFRRLVSVTRHDLLGLVFILLFLFLLLLDELWIVSVADEGFVLDGLTAGDHGSDDVIALENKNERSVLSPSVMECFLLKPASYLVLLILVPLETGLDGAGLALAEVRSTTRHSTEKKTDTL